MGESLGVGVFPFIVPGCRLRKEAVAPFAGQML
jgi:hypothetical protein